jgi:hypothetical protein
VIEQTSPGMAQWENLTYRDQPYVKVSPTERAKGTRQATEADVALYYSASGDALIVTPREDVLKRALDRQIQRKAGTEGKTAEATPHRPWLGSNVGLQVDRKALESLGRVFNPDYQQSMQRRAWDNLPILNQWKRLYPDQNPVELHRRVWHVDLVCPGGGQYVWNDAWQTMESTVYGHPGQPKPGPAVPPLLNAFYTADFGLTFENRCLRAVVSLDRASDKTEKPAAKQDR